MAFDLVAKLWPNASEQFFRDLNLQPIRQMGPFCVSTVLAMLTGDGPENFQRRINTQDPVSWSDSLRPFGMKLAFCPTDVRKVKFYLPELLAYDDLFTLSYYTPSVKKDILADPSEDGWVCGSHVVLFHRDSVLDPSTGTRTKAALFSGAEFHTKRIFRVVPADHVRGL